VDVGRHGKKMMATARAIIGPINIGNPTESTIWELAELVIDLTGSKSRIVTAPLPSDDPRQRQPDIANAQELLEWRPRIQLREGLLKTIEYFDAILTKDDEARDRALVS
jgi:UDP-glucuronate decarboxylase